MKKRFVIAGFVVIALSGSAVLAAQSDYPYVPQDPDTGAYTPVPVDEPGPCPADARVAEGSLCQRMATGGGEYAYEVVSLGEDRAPCERATAPAGTDPASCRVIEVEPSGLGDSALVTFTGADGEAVKVWVFPGEGNQIVFG